MRVAAIDCGTNSIRLLVLAGSREAPVELVREVRLARLGQGVDATGEFHPDALARTFAVCEEYARIIRHHGAEKVRFVATSAARDVSNRQLLVDGVRERLGVGVDVIPGQEEARLSSIGALYALDVASPTLVVDIGGGSTELVLADGTGRIFHSVSLNVGAVRLRERFLHTDAQRVDEGIAEVGPVELHLAADVRQPQAVAVATDPGDNTGQNTTGVGLVERSETQRIHHPDGPGPHREDVADDAPNTGCRPLIGLHKARVVVGFRLERDGVALADVDDTGVLADACQERAARGVLTEFTKFLQVHLRGFVGAVLRPHHRVHRQFGAGGATTEDLPDARVLVVLHAERRVRLLQVGGFQCMSHGVCHESKSIG